MTVVALLVLLVAACFEIIGDVKIGQGFATGSAASVLLGWLFLGFYGMVVNGYSRFTNGMNFARMLGVYIAVFAMVNLLLGLKRAPADVSIATIVGTVVIVLGGIIIQFGEPIGKILTR
ncbi:MAG TPA: hypothetical protein VF219_21810 [Vicinamibacterales bacterium]